MQHYCREVQQEPTVDSIDDAKAGLKISFFCCKASIAPPSATWPFKEYNCSMEMLFCFEKGAM